MNAPLLLDTCAAIWLSEGDGLSAEAEAAIHQRAYDAEGVAISPMTAWEISLLIARGRLALSVDAKTWVRELTTRYQVAIAPLTPDILITAHQLPGVLHRDPVDRILAATARESGYRLVTRDRALLAYAEQGYLRALAC